MNKEDRYRIVVTLDILICLLSPYLRHTTQTMVIKEGKNPHLCYNASITKKPTDDHHESDHSSCMRRTNHLLESEDPTMHQHI